MESTAGERGHMTFNPLRERGIPLDRQLRNWRELNVTPIDPDHWCGQAPGWSGPE